MLNIDFYSFMVSFSSSRWWWKSQTCSVEIHWLYIVFTVYICIISDKYAES